MLKIFPQRWANFVIYLGVGALIAGGVLIRYGHALAGSGSLLVPAGALAAALLVMVAVITFMVSREDARLLTLRERMPDAEVFQGIPNPGVVDQIAALAAQDGAVTPTILSPRRSCTVVCDATGMSFWGGARVPQLALSIPWSGITAVGVGPVRVNLGSSRANYTQLKVDLADATTLLFGADHEPRAIPGARQMLHTQVVALVERINAKRT